MVNAPIESAQFSILPDSRPGSLDELVTQPGISHTGDSTPPDLLTGGALRSDQPQKGSQLPDMPQVAPVTDSSQKLGACRPPNTRNGHQVAKRPFDLWLITAEAADLTRGFLDLPLRKLKRLNQPVQFKSDPFRTRQGFNLTQGSFRPLRAWKGNALKKQKGFNPALGGTALLDKGITQLRQVPQFAVGLCRNMDAGKLTTPEINS